MNANNPKSTSERARQAKATPDRANVGWAIVGWFNFIAVALIVLLVTGVRPTLWQILGGGAFFLIMTVLLIWSGLRQR
jgi:hypothetical protein